MKKSIIVLAAMIVSMASINCLKCKKDTSENQVGGIAACCYGFSSESSGWVDFGGIVAGLGGGALGTAGLSALGVTTLSNPVGWAIGGSVLL